MRPFSNNLEDPKGKKRGKLSEDVTQTLIQLWTNLLTLSPNFKMLFEGPFHMLWLYFPQIWSQDTDILGKTISFPHKMESKIKRKVWNKKWCSFIAKLYPHILIKRLHNAWLKGKKGEKSKEPTCWCRANWSATYRLSKARWNVKRETDLAFSPKVIKHWFVPWRRSNKGRERK